MYSDDDNLNNLDGCNEYCQIEAGWTCFGVTSTCTSTCGDGILVITEECDDGNTNNGDSCDSTCHLEKGWECTVKAGQANLDCVPICGDGLRVGNGKQL
jgi:cysteine-rich repeat protein